MKRWLVGLALVVATIGLASSPVLAKDTYVHGYLKSNGTYVLPYYRSAPDGNALNNWSTIGNFNPYTGAYGTKSEPSQYYDIGPVHVDGYLRSNGTYVGPYYRSAPDGNFYNNWSTRGNVNPFTGVPGTRVTPPAYNYEPYPTIDLPKTSEGDDSYELTPTSPSYPSLQDSEEDDGSTSGLEDSTPVLDDSTPSLDDSDDSGTDSDSDSSE